MLYPFKFRHRSAEKVESHDANFGTLSLWQGVEYKGEFQCMMDIIRAQESKVYFYFPPYHPIAFKILMERFGERVQEVQELISRLAEVDNATVFGNYDPAPFGLDSLDFWDGAHLQESGVKKVIEHALKDDPEIRSRSSKR